MFNNGCTTNADGVHEVEGVEIYTVLNAPLSLKRNARSQINNNPKKRSIESGLRKEEGTV